MIGKNSNWFYYIVVCVPVRYMKGFVFAIEKENDPLKKKIANKTFWIIYKLHLK